MQRHQPRPFLIAIGIAIANLGNASHALAQEASSTPAREKNTTQLEAVTVTAEHRAASINDVPITMDALDGKDLRTKGVTKINDLARYSPALNVHGPFGDNGYPEITLRGMNADNFSEISSQSVAVYVDDVYQSTAPLLGTQMFDLDRVEILKGPQGTLYGRNSIGGALNIHAAAPTFYPDGYFRIEAGNYQHFGFEGAYGAPINDALAYRVSTKLVRQWDGPFTNAQTGKDRGQLRQAYARGQLLYAPDDSLSILANIHIGIDHSDTWPYSQVAALVPDGQANAGSLCPAFLAGDIAAANSQCVDTNGYHSGTKGKNGNALSLYGRNDNKSYGGSLKIDADVGRARLTSVTGYEWMRTQAGYDEDSSPAPLIDTTRSSKVSQVSEELRLASQSEGPLQWMAGIYGSYDHVSGDPIFISNQAAWYAGSTADYSDLKTTTWGIFGQTDYALTERLKLTVGARYSGIGRDYRYKELWITDDSTSTTFAGNNTMHQSDWSGKIGLSYKATPGTMVYGNISRGFNAGTYSAYYLTSPQSLQPTDAETVIAYELGFKSTLFDRRLQLNGAVFYNDWDNIQVSAVENRSGIEASYLVNGKGADIYGAELEAIAKPSSNWNLNLGVAYLHSELRDLYVQDLEGNTVNINGRPLANSPEWQVNAAASYDKALQNNYRLTPQLDLKWEDTIYRDLLGTRVLRSAPHVIANASLTLANDVSGWDVQAWVHNLADKRYVTEAYQVVSAGMAGLAWNMPRTFGVTFTKNL